MTEAVFLKVLNMGVSAGYLIAAVLVLRRLLRRAPRWIGCLLWGIVALRLLCPVSFESVLSLIPSTEVVSPTIVSSPQPQIQSGIPVVDGTLNPVIGNTLAPDATASVNPAQILLSAATAVWIAGAAIILLSALVSYLRLRRRVATAVPFRDNIFQCETLPSPFILGIFKPRIYIPYKINPNDLPLVLAHEQAHLRRRDHWIKPLAYVLLAVYWFHPLVWVAYILLCRDIELACDQKVMRSLGEEARRAYATALLHCGTRSRRIAACPLAFGEVGVKARVKSVMHYKKPAFWIVLTAVVACAVVAVCFLTSPKTTPTVTDCGTPDEDVTIRVTELELEGDDPHITVRWKNESEHTVLLSGATSLWHEDIPQTAGTAFPSLSFREHELKAGASSAETYDLRNYTFKQAGTYRLNITFTKEQSEPQNAWVIFTVPEKLAAGLASTAPRVLDLYPQESGDRTFTQVTDEAFLTANGYHVYYYGFDKVEVQTADGTADLQTALQNGSVTVEALLEKAATHAEANEIDRRILKDGGTAVYYFGGYTLIKQNSLDGDRHFFIGIRDMTMDTLENFSPSVPPLSLTLTPQVSSGTAVHRVTDEGYRAAHGFDVYYYGLDAVQVETREGLTDLQPLLQNGTVTAEALVSDARQQADNGKIHWEMNKEDNTERFDFGAYQLVKCKGENGNGNLYIGPPDMKMALAQPQMTADVTGDGVAERITLAKMNVDYYELHFTDANGTLLWREGFAESHVGWNSLFLCATDEGNYLLRYKPEMSTGLACYSYCLFRPEDW